jgi:Kef-type K+ transport system membrane component KefB
MSFPALPQAARPPAPASKPLPRYLALVGVPLLAIAAALALLHADGAAAAARTAAARTAAVENGLLAHLAQPLPRFLLQLLVVLGAAKFAGWLARKAGQPAVIGEMLAGIVLGPSLFGWLLPSAQAWLFPAGGIGPLTGLSQLGVLLFMFAAGAEFDLSRLQGRRSLALVVSHTGIAVPFLLGVGLATLLHGTYAPAGVGFTGFALFMGIALSVTAFPVLLRILTERGLTATPIGTIAIACAAICDATAWILLGAVVAFVQAGSLATVGISLGLGLAFAVAMVRFARPQLAHVEIAAAGQGRAMVAMLLALLACGLFTEVIGLHALFGAFLAGVAVSRNVALRQLVETRIEPFATVLLLPLFFASTGLVTRLDLLQGNEWWLCLGIVGVATLGKLGATAVAARWSGLGGADSLRLGALMNTRGLMELIVLGLGLQLGLLDVRLFAILVLVAIITTAMTGPLLGAIDAVTSRRASAQPGPGTGSASQ